MKRTLVQFGTLALMLLGLPLAGVALAGKPLARYFEFPPRAQYVAHAPFSWYVFLLLGFLAIACLLPLLLQVWQRWKKRETAILRRLPFPWWGWLGMAGGIVAWILAWNRFPWFTPLQAHTFTPLWIAYILVINALTYRRTGRCMLMDRPGLFFILFPISAVFWWFFEYLNRFVQNWHYIGEEHFTPLEYFWYATLPFSTVLPAVLGTREWLDGFPFFKSFQHYIPLKIRHSKKIGAMVLLLSAAGLACIGTWPDYSFPLLWVSPLLIIVSMQTVTGERHVFSGITDGDWRLVVTSALAALICGFFWEMWNFHSFAKWVYAVPFVDRFHIFEMPILGYTGYLPFGLECVTIADFLTAKHPNKNKLLSDKE